MSRRKGSKRSADSDDLVGKRRTKRRRASWRRVAYAALGLLAIVAATYFVWPHLSPAPAVVHPQDQDKLDPAVAELIVPKIRAAERDPRNASLHADLAMAYEANALWNEARDSYAVAVALDDDHLPWRLHHAMTTRLAGDFRKGLSMLTELAKQDVTSAALQHRLAEALLEDGRLDEAETAFQRLAELNESGVAGQVGLADISLQRQRPEEAISILVDVVARQPENRKANYLLGRAYAMAGREEEAGPLLARGAESATVYLPDPLSSTIAAYAVNVTARLYQARILLEGGRPAQAASLLENTLQHHDSNTIVLNRLASAYLRTNRLDDAYRLLVRARELDREQFYTYLNLSEWALRIGDTPKSLAFADQAIERGPAHPDTHLARAQALTELGRYEEALASADKARELDAYKASNYALTGEICLRLKRFADARSYFDRATALDDAYLPAWVGLAHTHLALEQIPESRAALDRAIRIAPNHPAVRALAVEVASVR